MTLSVDGNLRLEDTPSPSPTDNTGSILSLHSDTKTFLPPRLIAASASAVSPINGMIAYVTTTNGTFTSAGFWGYEEGAWRKL